MLLKDQTLSTSVETVNIYWATNDYSSISYKEKEQKTEHYGYYSRIFPEDISGSNNGLITPRVFKHKNLQTTRAKERAEVFTPAWICNAQNNLVDERWFGRKNVFNTESVDIQGNHKWIQNTSHIVFPEGKDWKAYIRCRRLEMACGEAPYLVSRYDTTTGEQIPISKRIGIIDRKFRVISENTPAEPTKLNKRHWLRKAYQALQSVYGFDWQGDNVFLARESLFHTFCDYYLQRWGRLPHAGAMTKAAEIISWNVWQMDGTSFTIPHTDRDAIIMEWHCSEPLKGKQVSFKELIRK